MNIQKPADPSSSNMAQHFLHLLDDVHRTHGLYLEEIHTLRARVQELEASKGPEMKAANGWPMTVLPDIEGCAIFLETPEGVIQGWSRGAQESYGYTVEEAVGQKVSMLLPEGSGSFQRITKDGVIFKVLSHTTVLQDGQGQDLARLRLEIRADQFVDGVNEGGRP